MRRVGGVEPWGEPGTPSSRAVKAVGKRGKDIEPVAVWLLFNYCLKNWPPPSVPPYLSYFSEMRPVSTTLRRRRVHRGVPAPPSHCRPVRRPGWPRSVVHLPLHLRCEFIPHSSLVPAIHCRIAHPLVVEHIEAAWRRSRPRLFNLGLALLGSCCLLLLLEPDCLFF